MATTNHKTPAHASNVYLFKNGYGMIVKTFDFPSDKDNKDQHIELIDPPSNPVHGTFWIQSLSNQTSITSIRTKKTRRIVDKECLTVEDLLEANIGQDVDILVTDSISQSKEWTAGKIQSIKRCQQLSDDEDTDSGQAPTSTVNSSSIPMAGIFDSRHMPSTYGHVKSPIKTGDLVLFETTDHGLLALPLSSVRSIRGTTLKTMYPHKMFESCLSIDYKNESGSNDTGLMKYLTYGITWAPSYNLVLLSSNDPSVKRLRLSSKAVILNDTENMIVKNLFCILGFPNISKFAEVIDPMISGANVKTFLDQLNQCEVNVTRGRSYHQPGIMSNSIMTQQMVMPMSTVNNSGPDETLQDTNVDDLHLYDFQNVLLQKKERLMLPIFDVEISYRDVYHCKISSTSSALSNAGYEENKQFEEVWHSVEFENLTNFVLTTAPVLITKGQQEQQFLGQDTITYTSKGSTTFVNLTKALDIRVQLDEKVLNTNATRFTFLGAKYQADNIEGKVTVMNYKSEDVVVVINVVLMGKISNYSVTPKTDIVKTNESTTNQHHDIRWKSMSNRNKHSKFNMLEYIVRESNVSFFYEI